MQWTVIGSSGESLSCASDQECLLKGSAPSVGQGPIVSSSEQAAQRCARSKHGVLPRTL
jgi:hypothetical protein